MHLIDKTAKETFNRIAKEKNLLPIKVTSHYLKLVKEEYEALGHYRGPLYKVVYPTKERLELRIKNEVPDFVEDRTNMPSGLENILIHKYSQRALFLITDRCAGHCMYCFRQDVLSDSQGRPLPEIEQRLDRVLAYLKKHPEIKEIILSGGDPLNIPFLNLEQTFERIIKETSVTNIRIHTRNIVFAPKVLSEKICKLLAEYRVRIYLHIVHPYELEDEVGMAIERMRAHGVRMYGQFPILRGINDHKAVLARLLDDLDNLNIQVINLFIPDPISYSASFRLPMQRLLDLMDNLYWSTSSWVNGVRLVLDTPIGKVRREDIVDWDKEKAIITFQREGKNVIYHDFPQELDEASDEKTLLWKDQ